MIMAQEAPESTHRKGAICPRCGADRVHRSHRRDPAEKALSLLGARICRCHACEARFARVASSTLYMDDARRLLRRLRVLALAIAGILLVLAVVSWSIENQAAPPPSDGRVAQRPACLPA